jgi:hypothetical protein
LDADDLKEEFGHELGHLLSGSSMPSLGSTTSEGVLRMLSAADLELQKAKEDVLQTVRRPPTTTTTTTNTTTTNTPTTIPQRHHRNVQKTTKETGLETEKSSH